MTGRLRRMLWATWEPIAAHAARRYVAGPELSDAVRVARALAGTAIGTTICRWDGDGEPPRLVADSYKDALAGLEGMGLDCYLSIKAPSLGFSVNLMDELLEVARPAGVGIHFDSLAPESAEPTWELTTATAARYPSTGCTLPARWRRSLSDADRAVDLGLRVRVVKGQWGDPAANGLDVRASYLAVIDRLAGRASGVAVATHDAPLAREAVDRLRAAGTPCELELLFGLPAGEPLRVARASGVGVRFYVPYGHAWLPYCLSQVRRRPRLLWWTMRDWLLGWRGLSSIAAD